MRGAREERRGLGVRISLGRADATANALVVPAVSGARGISPGTTEGAAELAAIAVGATPGITLARATW